jgi:phage portal protein BeeE
VGVRSWWADLQTPKAPVQRDINPFSLTDYLAYFSYAGNLYPLSMSTDLQGQRESITRDFGGYVHGAYAANGVIFACMMVRYLVFSDARLTFRKFMPDGRPGDLYGPLDGRTPGYRDLQLLAQPWQGATTGDLLARMLSDVDLAGNAFILRQANRLRRLRPDWCSIVVGAPRKGATMWDLDAEVLGYLYTPGGPHTNAEPVALRPEQVCHFAPYPDPTAPHRGISWVTPVLRELMADSAASEHKLAFFENGATVNLGIKFDASTTRDMYLFAKEQFLDAHQGAENAYKTLFLLGADPVPVGSSMVEMDFKVVQGAGETRIAAAAGVPPIIAGFSEGLASGTYSNYGQARRRFADATLRPLWRNACGSLANIVTVPQGSQLWYDDRDVAFLREDQGDRATIVTNLAAAARQLIEAGWQADAVIAAITNDDLDSLTGKHTGLFSVQLQAPGSQKMPQGEVPGEKPVEGTKPGDIQPGEPTAGATPAPPNGKTPVPSLPPKAG